MGQSCLQHIYFCLIRNLRSWPAELLKNYFPSKYLFSMATFTESMQFQWSLKCKLCQKKKNLDYAIVEWFPILKLVEAQRKTEI